MPYTLPQGTPLDLIQRGLGNNIMSYAVGHGYGGPTEAQGGDIATLTALLGPERAAALLAGVNGINNPNRQGDEMAAVRLSEGARDKQALDWLASQGYQASGVDTGKEWWQQLLDPAGNVVATDAYNYANDGAAAQRLGLAGAALIGGLAYGGLGGAGALGGGEAGAGAAGLSTPGIGASDLAGIGLSNPSPLASVPTFGTSGLGTAGITAADLGGLSSAGLEASGFANPLTMSAPMSLDGIMPALTQGISTQGIDQLKPFDPTPVPNVPSTIPGAGLESLSKFIPGLDALKGAGQYIAPLIGAVAGASEGGKPNTASSQSKTDPRIDPFIYGDNGVLNAAQQWFNQNRSGTNADMQAGMGQLRDLYTSPQYQQGYQQMRQVGQGLLSQAPAGNPFTNGLLGQFQQPQMGAMPQGLMQIPEAMKQYIKAPNQGKGTF